MPKKKENKTNFKKDDCDSHVRKMILKDRIGLENLPYQVVKQNKSQGFAFNLMCIGETGIGKSTLISSLFNIQLEDTINTHKHPKVALRSSKHSLHESGVNLQLEVVETIGYGDQIQKQNSFECILSYLDSQFENYLREELNPRRQLSSVRDTRIHACLFFICPTGHSLKCLDLACLKSLEKRVNIIPIIGKADTLSENELLNFKSNIRSELDQKSIEIYHFPMDEDPVVNQANMKFNAMVPFAAVGSAEFVSKDGNLVRGRNYPWGDVCVRNKRHCDTLKLLEAMVEINLEDLKEQTHVKHYENYRRARLEDIGGEIDEKGTFNLRDVWCKLNMEEGRNKLHSQEENLIQGFIGKAEGIEMELANADMAMTNKCRSFEQKIQLEKRKLEKEADLLNSEMNCFFTRLQEKGFLKTGDLKNFKN